MTKTLLPVFYFPPVDWFAVYLKNPTSTVLEVHEHFVKQSYRNRTEIYGANGKLKLMIPVRHQLNRGYADTRISYAEDWQIRHWRSLTSAYQRSAYYDFYADDLHQVLNTRYDRLVELNFAILKVLFKMLKIASPIETTKAYASDGEFDDYRSAFSAKKSRTLTKEVPYYQEFQAKNGFIKNLSILDLLFNQGPESITYLKRII